ncbi:oil body-associated protein 2A-like [Diospyros lotus]|uniref:oil body-associated protein 2A-like n=1 Tax=Diospyros lotus TaxID=55363 RepID=UPI0022513AAF|nr:oil body-associated protein 2A-like [Diospyros lotus]
MASSDRSPGEMPPGDGAVPPGKPMTVGQQVLDMGAQMMQSMKPLKQMSQHVCTFAVYSHDVSRQIEAHHYVCRANQDFLQCAVFDSDDSNAHLIGVEYVVSGRVFDSLPVEEQKLWHSHAHEIKSGLWVNPRVPEMISRSELEDLAGTYGKFWCTWQVDRGDRLPLGAPSLMMSPQEGNMGLGVNVNAELVIQRDATYGISTDGLKSSRADLQVPAMTNPYADYWQKTGKGFALDIEKTEIKLIGDS